MSSYRPRGGHQQAPYRPSFYDDQPESGSRSRSPPRSPHHDSRDKTPPKYRDGIRSQERRRSDRSPSRSRSHSRERPSSRGHPSREVMLEDIAQHVTEKDIFYELQQHYRVGQLEDVRIIKDKQTSMDNQENVLAQLIGKGQSRGFGFIRFPTLAEAQTFMDANFPMIYIYGDSSKGNTSEDAKVRLAYGRERKEDRPEADWICKVCNINNFPTRARCFRCQALKPEPSVIQKASNIGDNDAAPDNTPSQFLLLRGLEPTVSEELFVKGVAKLNKPSGPGSQPANQTQKKGKVASTTGDANLGAKEGTLRRILLIRDRKTGESWRYGFAEYATIEDAQAALTRFNSFDRFTIASKQVLVSYIHAGVFVPVTDSTPATERFTFSPLGNPALKLQYWDEEAYVTELVVSSAGPSTMTSKAVITNPAESEGIKPTTDDKDKLKKRKPQPDTSTSSSAKKATPSHLQFWSNRHAELHGLQKSSEKSTSPSSDSAPPLKSYADLSKHCCYLCMRQFSTAVEVNKHERLSDLHHSNLKDEAKVKRAEHKLEKHDITPASQSVAANSEAIEDKQEYRDRAKERRKVYGVVNKKGEQLSSTPANSRAAKERSTSPPPASKGANLLAKMGYSGQGLGVRGEGMTAPLAQNVYAAGVGLGAVGGNLGDAVEEADRRTRGDYGEWVEQGRDRARERYHQL